MMKKSGFIGEQEINLIKGYAGVLSWIGGVKKKRFTDIELVFYSTVFQSGIEQYIFPESVSGKASAAEFVRKERDTSLPRDLKLLLIWMKFFYIIYRRCQISIICSTGIAKLDRRLLKTQPQQ